MCGSIIWVFLLNMCMNGCTLFAQDTINWKDFMERNDMVYDTLTTSWTDGLFTGNGLVGNTIFMEDSNALRIDIGRTDVIDHRSDTGFSNLFNKARLPIGHFILRPVGHIKKVTARLDLWNAEARGILVTDSGRILWRSLTLAQTNIVLFWMQGTNAERQSGWTWVPALSQSPRISFQDYNAHATKKYIPNPAPVIKTSKNIDFCFQPMTAGGGYSTAWTIKDHNAQKPIFEGSVPFKADWDRLIYISVGYDSVGQTATAYATGQIQAAVNANPDALIDTHRSWWHNYYPKSFISLPDQTMQSFYWIQQYKLACASRPRKPLIDLMGPWMAATPWPGNWWNLNTELTYSPLYAANRLDIAAVLPATINKNLKNLIANVPRAYQYNSLGISRAGGQDMVAPIGVTGGRTDRQLPDDALELGDGTWLLYYYWLQYRYSMDKTVLTSLYPILKRNINYYLHLIHKGRDNKYHLPFTYSPEYPGGVTRDANYALSLLRWGCMTLVKADSILQQKDPLCAKWNDVLANLVNYPTDANGLKIGADVPFKVSHRHYSHMLMIYPLHLLNWDQPQDRELISRSLQHWHSMPGALQGYSFTGGASIYATMGKGNEARDYLKELISRYIKPNTMYMESGPVIETPLAAACSIQELLIQSWGDKIRVFPAVPSDWADVSFENLRTEGAFLISAVRRGSRTRWLRIKATTAGICNLETDMQGKLQMRIDKGSLHAGDLKQLSDHLYRLSMHKGDMVTLFVKNSDLDYRIQDSHKDEDKALHPFGKKIKQQLQSGNHKPS